MEFDETLPWKKLPHFIQERIYWRPMVHARNEMGWKALHEQLFPLKYGNMRCWDCGHALKRVISGFWGLNFENNDYQFYCPQCELKVRQRRYPITLAHHHPGLYSRPLELPMDKLYVFGYLTYSFYHGRNDPKCNFYHRLLTGYHISRGSIGNALLVRYFDDDNTYTRQHRVFRPIFLWNDLQATFI